MNFIVTRKNNLNIPMFTMDGKIEKEFNIQTMKKVSMQLYEMKYNNQPIEYKVTCADESLETSRKKLENSIKSILEDKELYSNFIDWKENAK